MPKKENSKAYNARYMAVLNKFGVLPSFHFTDLEKDIVKGLEETGEIGFLDFCDHFDIKPEKGKKVIKELVKKHAINFENDLISITPIAIKYLHSTKKERKSYKKFRKFVNALNEKDLQEFMGLVDSFVVNPDAPIEPEEAEEKAEAEPAIEEAKPEEVPVEEPKPVEEPMEEAPAEEPKAAPKVPRKRVVRKKPAPKAEESKPEKGPAEETKAEENPNV